MSPRLRWTAAVMAGVGSIPNLLMAVWLVADSLGKVKPRAVDLGASLLMVAGSLLVVLSGRALVKGRGGWPHLVALGLAGFLWIFPAVFATAGSGGFALLVMLALLLLITSFVLTVIAMIRDRV